MDDDQMMLASAVLFSVGFAGLFWFLFSFFIIGDFDLRIILLSSVLMWIGLNCYNPFKE